MTTVHKYLSIKVRKQSKSWIIHLAKCRSFTVDSHRAFATTQADYVGLSQVLAIYTANNVYYLYLFQ